MPWRCGAFECDDVIRNSARQQNDENARQQCLGVVVRLLPHARRKSERNESETCQRELSANTERDHARKGASKPMHCARGTVMGMRAAWRGWKWWSAPPGGGCTANARVHVHAMWAQDD